MMSTDFSLSKKISACDLFGGRLQKFGIQEHVSSETDEARRCLTDGRNYLWVYLTEDGQVGGLSRYGANAPSKILNAIAEAFDTEIFSEHEPQFWGFDTQAEWDAAMESWDDECRQTFYAELCAYIRGEPNDIRPGTVGEIQAKIAKTLVEKDAAFLQPENKNKLMAEMEATYKRDHAVVVALSPKDIEMAKMQVTHEDDLPRA